MTLAIFDLDNTLLDGDSDYLWGCFLCEEGLVDATSFLKNNDQFFADYLSGSLDIVAYQEFILQPLKNLSKSNLERLRKKFISEKIKPIIHKKSQGLIAEHVRRGHHPLIITATNDFITEPIAQLMKISDLLACKVEFKNGYCTGKTVGSPTFREGKVIRLNEWLNLNKKSLKGAWFYTDSHNDLPMLETVDNPVAVDPDKRLRSIANSRGWKIISLKSNLIEEKSK